MKLLTNHKKLLVSGCIFILLAACQQNNNKATIENASPYFSIFFTGNEDAVLRGIQFNCTPDELKKLEKAKLYESTPDHLFYEFSYPKDSTTFSEYANIQYFFNENNQLDIITAEIYLNDSTQEQQLKNNLIEYYNQRFGNPEKDEQDHEVWTGYFTDATLDKKISYSVAIKEINGEFGIGIEYVRQ